MELPLAVGNFNECNPIRYQFTTLEKAGKSNLAEALLLIHES